MYYLNTFDDYESLERAIEEFIYYYNNKRDSEDWIVCRHWNTGEEWK